MPAKKVIATVETPAAPSAPVEEENVDVPCYSESDDEKENVEPPLKRSKFSKKRRPVLSDKIPAIPVAAFQRLVREVTFDQQLDKSSPMLWEGKALEALQVGAEAFVVDKFYQAYRKSLMCKKKTVGVTHFD